jgi:hypothetical protein
MPVEWNAGSDEMMWRGQPSMVCFTSAPVRRIGDGALSKAALFFEYTEHKILIFNLLRTTIAKPRVLKSYYLT